MPRSLAGIDPASGERLWSFDDVTGNSTPTPVPLGNGRFLLGATVGRNAGNSGQASQSNGVVQIRKTDDRSYRVGYVWRAQRATSSFGSPIAHAGYAYFVNRSGVVYCLDLQTGEEMYAQRAGSSNWATPIGVDDRIYLFGKDGVTTVIAAGPTFDKLSTNPLWSNVAESALSPAATGMGPSGPVLYAAAIVDTDLYLRRGDRLYKVSNH